MENTTTEKITTENTAMERITTENTTMERITTENITKNQTVETKRFVFTFLSEKWDREVKLDQEESEE